MPTSPARSRRQAARRWAAGSPLCSTATSSPKRARKRAASCGVRAISGTSTSAPRPCCRASAIRRRYTSVLPDPVTPCSTKAAKPLPQRARQRLQRRRLVQVQLRGLFQRAVVRVRAAGLDPHQAVAGQGPQAGPLRGRQGGQRQPARRGQHPFVQRAPQLLLRLPGRRRRIRHRHRPQRPAALDLPADLDPPPRPSPARQTVPAGVRRPCPPGRAGPGWRCGPAARADRDRPGPAPAPAAPPCLPGRASGTASRPRSAGPAGRPPPARPGAGPPAAPPPAAPGSRPPPSAPAPGSPDPAPARLPARRRSPSDRPAGSAPRGRCSGWPTTNPVKRRPRTGTTTWAPSGTRSPWRGSRYV